MMMVRVVKRYMLVGACLVQVPLKMTKVIQSLNELERHWGVMKKSPGMPPGANTINPCHEGGRHPAFIADECRLWITVHYLPNESYESS